MVELWAGRGMSKWTEHDVNVYSFLRLCEGIQALMIGRAQSARL